MSKETAMAIATGVPVAAPQETPIETPQAPSQPSPDSRSFAHLAKKEAELQKERQSFLAEKSKLEEANKQYNEYLNKKKEDPIAALKMLGFSESDIFNYMAAAAPVEKTAEEKAIEAAAAEADRRIKAFEETQAKKEAEAQKQADNSLIQTYKSDVAKAIQADPITFEYCNYHGPLAQDLIYETVLAVVKESGGKDVPTPLEAAQMVEEFYEEQDKAMMNLKKRQPKSAPVEEPKKDPERTRTVVEKPKTDDIPKPTRTITRNATVTAASARNLTETREQKRERLIEKLRGGA